MDGTSTLIGNSRAVRSLLSLFAAFLLTLAGFVVLPAPAAYAAFPTVSWPGNWANPLGSDGSFIMTTKWGAFSLGCRNADRANDAAYYLNTGVSAHTGIDMNRGDGQNVYAIADGTVVENGQPWGASNRNVVVVEHTAGNGDRFLAVYGHLYSDVVAKGAITRGARIGRVQNAGTGPHLHFGVRPGAWAGVTPNGSSASGVDANGNCSFNPVGTVDPLSYLAAGPPGAIGEGSFVSHDGHVYRIAGGAPIYVSTWNVFGGAQPTTAISNAQFNGLRAYPADGTFVHGASTGRVFRFAGGAPHYVSTWNSFGGPQPTIAVDDYTLDRPDSGPPLNHIRRYPADGTFVHNVGNGTVYRIAGGAPLAVSSWANIGGAQPFTSLDPWEFANYQHLKAWPSDMFLRGNPSGRVFRVVWDGHPYYVESWEPYGGTQPYLDVDDWAIDNCDHLACSPFGYLDNVTASGGKVTVEGWAIDPNARTQPVTIHVYVGGPAGDPNADGFDVGTAAANHTGVGKTFPGTGNNHGYLKTVTTSKRGSQPVYVYALNVDGTKGSHTEIGHKTVTVATPVGQFTAAPTPKVSGTVKVGHTLTAIPGTWKPAGATLSYTWFRNETAISGATSAEYTLVGADKGARIQVTVTGKKAGYQTTNRPSKKTTPVAAGSLHKVTPKITGTRKVGRTLTAVPGAWRPTEVALTYQWYRGTKKIANATAATYLVQKSDKGKKLKVKATGRLAGWSTASRTSKYTGKIK